MPANGGHTAILLNGRYRIARKRALVSTRSRRSRLAGEWWPYRDFVEWPLSLRPQAGSYVGSGMHTVVLACRRWVGMPRFCWMAAIASPASGLLHGLGYPHGRAGLPANGGHTAILLDGRYRFARKRAPTWRWYADGRAGLRRLVGMPRFRWMAAIASPASGLLHGAGMHTVVPACGDWWACRDFAGWPLSIRPQAGSYMALVCRRSCRLAAIGGHAAISLDGRHRFARKRAPTWALGYTQSRRSRLAGDWWACRDFAGWPLSLRPQAGAGMHTVA